MNNKKNYILYWMIGISGVLTVPISTIILNRVQSSVIVKTILIMSVFIALLLAAVFLYKNIFGVTVQEITQDEKATEIDKSEYRLTSLNKKYSNRNIHKCIEATLSHIQWFKRRKNVLMQIAKAGSDSADSGPFEDLIKTVEDALVINIGKLINRIEIFDDNGIPDIIQKNIDYINNLMKKNENILTEFETLITEASQMGDVREEKDISKLRDVVNAMQSLREDKGDEIDYLEKKYN